MAATKAAEAKRVAGTSQTLALDRYVGAYSDSLYGDASVSKADDRLRIRVGALEGTLEHWQYDTFRILWDNRWIGTGLVTFVLAPDGSPSRLEIDRRRFTRPDRGR